MNIQEGIKEMRRLQKTCLNWDKSKVDKEALHEKIDELLLKFVPPEIKEEYDRIIDEEGPLWYS